METKIIFNGKEYANSEAMPEEVRQAYRQAMAHFADADKFDLQQYITRCYGSLTTFNILFKNKDDQFRTGA